MGDTTMIKVGPVGQRGATKWDEKHSEIVQIFISHGYGICSLQCLYVDGDGALVLSDRHGKSIGDEFDVVTLNYPSEYMNCIRIRVATAGTISSITLETNLGVHGPFGQPNESHKEFCFRLGKERGFGGFYGTTDDDDGVISSIGVYIKPITSLNANGRHDLDVKPNTILRPGVVRVTKFSTVPM